MQANMGGAWPVPRTLVSPQSRALGGGANNLPGVVNVSELFWWLLKQCCVSALCDIQSAVQYIRLVKISRLVEPDWR